MDRRLALQTVLETLLGSRNVYFQPPESIIMKYPCIVYKRSRIASRYANNRAYLNRVGYLVTVIDPAPNNETVKDLLTLPLCSYDREYVSANLNHTVLNLYF